MHKNTPKINGKPLNKKQFSKAIPLITLHQTIRQCPKREVAEHILSALMQFPSARRLRLMWAPSTILFPLFCVLAALSDPARSMRKSFPMRSCWWMPSTRLRWRTEIMRTAWEREDVLLAAVGSWVLCLLPSFRIAITWTHRNCANYFGQSIYVNFTTDKLFTILAEWPDKMVLDKMARTKC